MIDISNLSLLISNERTRKSSISVVAEVCLLFRIYLQKTASSTLWNVDNARTHSSIARVPTGKKAGEEISYPVYMWKFWVDIIATKPRSSRSTRLCGYVTFIYSIEMISENENDLSRTRTHDL